MGELEVAALNAAIVGMPTACPPFPESEATASDPVPTPVAAILPIPTPEKVVAVMRAGRVTGIGDSIMLGASADMRRSIDDFEIDAAVGRQVSTALNLIKARKTAGGLGEIVVVDIGTNGVFTGVQFDQMMKSLADQSRVVFVNVKVPRIWEESNNAAIAAGVERYSNTVLVDWHAASFNHPEYFASDEIHLGPSGTKVFASLVAAAIEVPLKQ